jgi:regulatory protein
LADSAYLDGLKLLARRELSVAGLKARLVDREHAPEDIAAAVERLLETRALDDARVARAHARTSVNIKGRGRLRVMRELHEMGIAKDVAGEALAEVFGELDERSLIAKALQKKLRGRPRITGPAEHARLYQYLMRQGFSPAAVIAALRKLGGRVDDSIE